MFELCALVHVRQRNRSNFFASQSNAEIPTYRGRTLGLGNVAHYRLYQIGPDGRIRSGIDLDCADDAEAMEAAEQLVGEYAVELWQAKRMVARLEPKKK